MKKQNKIKLITKSFGIKSSITLDSSATADEVFSSMVSLLIGIGYAECNIMDAAKEYFGLTQRPTPKSTKTKH